jgi:hypothetical protein
LNNRHAVQEERSLTIVAYGSAGDPFRVVPNSGNQPVPIGEILHLGFALQSIAFTAKQSDRRQSPQRLGIECSGVVGARVWRTRPEAIISFSV